MHFNVHASDFLEPSNGLQRHLRGRPISQEAFLTASFGRAAWGSCLLMLACRFWLGGWWALGVCVLKATRLASFCPRGHRVPSGDAKLGVLHPDRARIPPA